MKLSREMLHPQGPTTGYNSEQLAAVGVPWPPPKGWLDRLVGTEIAEEKYREFVALAKGSKKRQRAAAKRAGQLDFFA